MMRENICIKKCIFLCARAFFLFLYPYNNKNCISFVCVIFFPACCFSQHTRRYRCLSVFFFFFFSLIIQFLVFFFSSIHRLLALEENSLTMRNILWSYMCVIWGATMVVAAHLYMSYVESSTDAYVCVYARNAWNDVL